MRAQVLKYAEHFVVPFLTKLFDKFYDMSYFPLGRCKSVNNSSLQKKAMIMIQTIIEEYVC